MKKLKLLLAFIIMSLMIVPLGSFASELYNEEVVGGGREFTSPSLLELIKLSHYTYGDFPQEHWGMEVDETVLANETLRAELEELNKLPGFEKSQQSMNGWVIQDQSHSEGDTNKSGFDGTVFKKGNVWVIAFRGTEIKKEDILTDAGLFLSLADTQLPSAINLTKEVFENIDKQNNEGTVIITGHSLGGYIAQKVAHQVETGALHINNKELLKGAVTFNAPGVWKKDYKASEWNNIQNGNYDHLITNYVISADIVSGVTFDDHIGKTIILPFLSIQDSKHSLKSFYAYDFNIDNDIVHSKKEQVANDIVAGTFLSSVGREWFDAGYDGATLMGYSGNDVYVYREGYGVNTIVETAYIDGYGKPISNNGTDTLYMPTIDLKNLLFTKKGSDLIIYVSDSIKDDAKVEEIKNSSKDYIVIKDFYIRSNTSIDPKIEIIKLANNIKLDLTTYEIITHNNILYSEPLKTLDKLSLDDENFSVFGKDLLEEEKKLDGDVRYVPSNKVWTVRFNGKVDPNSIDHNSIYILDKNNSKVSTINLTVNNDSVTIANSAEYIEGETYLLSISTKVKSNSGNPLKSEVKLTFMVEDIVEKLSNQMLNEGEFAAQDEWVYYTNSVTNKGLIKEKLNEEERHTLLDESNKAMIKQINVIGDWVYYINSGVLYKTSKDGKTTRPVTPNVDDKYQVNYISKYLVQDGWIYAIIRKDQWTNGLYKTKVSDLGDYSSQKLPDNWTEMLVLGLESFSSLPFIDKFSVIDNWIYFFDRGNIYRIDTDGQHKEMVVENITETYNLNKDFYAYSIIFPDIETGDLYFYGIESNFMKTEIENKEVKGTVQKIIKISIKSGKQTVISQSSVFREQKYLELLRKYNKDWYDVGFAGSAFNKDTVYALVGHDLIGFTNDEKMALYGFGNGAKLFDSSVMKSFSFRPSNIYLLGNNLYLNSLIEPNRGDYQLDIQKFIIE